MEDGKNLFSENVVDDILSETTDIPDSKTPKQGAHSQKIENLAKVEAQKLEEAMATLGIYFDDQENKKAILNYSRAVANFRELIENQKSHYEALARYEADDEIAQKHIEKLHENLNKISNYFESLISFFVSPPSKEVFELTNHAILLKSVYQSFKDFSIKFEELRIDDQFERNKVKFLGHINNIENFESSINSRLESMSNGYEKFLNSFVEKQTTQLNSFNERSRNLAKGYDDFLQKNLKFFKGGVWVLVILNVALALGLGILVALCIIKFNELDDLTAFSDQLDRVSVSQDDKSLTFSFPNETKIIEENGVKKVIITK